MRAKTILLSLLFGCFAVLGGYIAFVASQVPACNPSEQVATAVDAIEFAKYWLRRDDRLPLQLGLASIDTIDEKLAAPDCCEAQALDPRKNNGRAWKVAVRAVKPEHFEIFYSVSFSACRRSVIENRQIRKYPAVPLDSAQ